MICRRLTIINKLGLHARAAGKFVSTAGRFESNVMVKRGEREINGKSIMGVMLLAAGRGSEIELEIDGADEEQAMEALTKLINSRFGEDE